MVETAAKPVVIGKADVCQGLIATGDCAAVHLLVSAVADVHRHHRGLVAVAG